MDLIQVIGFDWYLAFYPAIRDFLMGESPYQNTGMVVANPPWTFLLLAPLGLLEASWGFVVLGLINITGLLALFYKFRQPRLVLPMAISFPFIALILWGNIDGLNLWGLAIGGPLGLILLSTKPQVAFLVSVIWIKQAWEQGKVKAVVQLVAPLLIIAIVMIYKYPEWIRIAFMSSARIDGQLTNGYPWFIPAGLGILVAAVRSEREDLAAVATVLLSPYVRVQSWVAALSLLIIRYPLEGTIIALSSWAILLVLQAQ